MSKRKVQSPYNFDGTLSEETLAAAWAMRQQRIYTMREIAEKFEVAREQLITELEAWLGKGAEA